MWAAREDGWSPPMVTGRPLTPRDLKVIFDANRIKARHDARRRR